MNAWNALRLGAFILTTLLPIQRHRREIDAARAAGDDAREQEWIRLAENDWGPRLFRHWKVRSEVTGETALPEGGVLFVSNHEGYGDIPLFMDVVRSKQFGFVAKDELGKIPVFNKWIVRIRSLMLMRGDAKETLRVFAEGEDMLKRGFSLVIFPEGHRAKGLGMQPFQKGSLRLALKARVPVVPVSVKGSWDCFEAYGFPTPGVIRVHLHAAIPTQGLSKEEGAALAERVERIIRGKLDEWAAEDVQAERAQV
ncbi:MAG: 1-acyl-sn-glycerol-3-phosphate acyltransferase [Clostridiales Family XIII bacterium]|jgi:1-acyl-sn-glycerol-3-phosphate acyltransferase|nr:1-acyl-sn-glycerol-3-phosphate acyltransferase [Clostridiales Family XIII bacterium]